jgi:hypothetical protein
MQSVKRRDFLKQVSLGAAALGSGMPWSLSGQEAGDRPARSSGVTVRNPRCRVPVSWIIDDSTCLVNLNRFAMPQFDEAFGGKNTTYHRNWREWPVEIPDDFVRKFGEWCGEHGVKGKYSIVPYPACVGRMDLGLPGWSRRDLEASLELVRTVMMPNWDIHPEMITHTRVLDLRTGQPYPEVSTKYMENWDWSVDRSAEELTEYLAYALRILKNAGLPCEGLTTPGGFGSQARPQLAKAALDSVRAIFGTEIPHYFRDAYDQGSESVAPRVELASGLGGADPRCVVSVVACTGDWTGGWDCTEPEGPDRFITADLRKGRMVDIIQRGEPACLLSHWTGVYWNGKELGFKVFQEVYRRLHARFDNLLWMKLCEISRYWAARELTEIERAETGVKFRAPFACPDFTVACPMIPNRQPRLRARGEVRPLKEASTPLQLGEWTWCRAGEQALICFPLPKGECGLEWA